MTDKIIKPNQTLPQEHLKMLIGYIEERAEGLRQDAGFNGAMHDGGSGALLNETIFYMYGRRGVLPLEWEKDYKEVLRRHDPEWTEYQRLKSKFE